MFVPAVYYVDMMQLPSYYLVHIIYIGMILAILTFTSFFRKYFYLFFKNANVDVLIVNTECCSMLKGNEVPCLTSAQQMKPAKY